MRTFTTHRFLATFIAACGIGAAAHADLLSDAELYFNPASLQPDFYSRLVLGDLASQHTITFDAGSNPVIGANILPMLRPGDYVPGYSYSQADYFHTPNSDYYADLTSGSLAASFLQPGLYHIRTYRADGRTDVFAVFAESELKETEGKPNPTGNNKQMSPLPDADLFLVDVSDAVGRRSADIWRENGRTVEEVTSKTDAVDKIKKASQKAGRKIHVELDGHGNSGLMSVGGGKNPSGDTLLDSSSAVAFAKDIQAYCNNLTFQGCLVGSGTAGQSFLQTISSHLGSAGGWNSTVNVVDSSGFSVSQDAKFIQIPGPASTIPLLFTTLFAVRRRRA